MEQECGRASGEAVLRVGRDHGSNLFLGTDEIARQSQREPEVMRMLEASGLERARPPEAGDGTVDVHTINQQTAERRVKPCLVGRERDRRLQRRSASSRSDGCRGPRAFLYRFQ